MFVFGSFTGTWSKNVKLGQGDEFLDYDFRGDHIGHMVYLSRVPRMDAIEKDGQ